MTETRTSPDNGTNVLFITINDPSQSNAADVAVKEKIKSFASHDSINCSVICPFPLEQMDNNTFAGVDRVYYLPKRTAGTASSVIYHGKLQFIILKKIAEHVAQNDVDTIVTRLEPSLWAPPVAATLLNVPFVPLARTWLKGGEANSSSSYQSLVNLVYKLNFKVGDHTFVPVTDMKQEIQEIEPEFPVHLFANAVDPDVIRPIPIPEARKAIEGIEPEDFVLGFVGSLSSQHAIEEMFAGFAERIGDCDDVHLLIVGNNPGDRSRVTTLEDRVKNLGIADKTTFVGRVPHSEIPRYISAFDAGYGVTYPHHPATPMKIYEYLACGRPVITYDQPELSFIKEFELGEVVSDITTESVGESIERMYETEQNVLLKKGSQGREYVKRNHSWDNLPQRMLEELEGSL